MPSQPRVPLRPRVVGGGGGGRGNSLSAMRERIEAAKANDSDVDAKLRDFTAFAGRQKQKTKLQAHQLDWRQEHGRLTRERAELDPHQDCYCCFGLNCMVYGALERCLLSYFGCCSTMYKRKEPEVRCTALPRCPNECVPCCFIPCVDKEALINGLNNC